MARTIQARLDRESQEKLNFLVRRLGWSPSRVVREGLRLLAGCQAQEPSKRIIGLGKFVSGIGDLGSNMARLKGFGR